MTKIKKIFICTTEQSGDNIASEILKKIVNKKILLDGVGGYKTSKYLRRDGLYYKPSLFVYALKVTLLLALNLQLNHPHLLSQLKGESTNQRFLFFHVPLLEC